MKKTPDFFDEKSKTGVGFEIGQPQRKCQRRRPTLQSMANPSVVEVLKKLGQNFAPQGANQSPKNGVFYDFAPKARRNALVL